MKSVEEIYNEMMAAYADATGTEAAGSGDLAVRMYAMAAQVFSLYVQCGWVERQCFPQTAEGTCLDMHAQLRGLERRAATAAVSVPGCWTLSRIEGSAALAHAAGSMARR